MKRTSKEFTEHLLRKMTVDMVMDLWQTKECALSCIEELNDQLEEFNDHPNYEKKKAELMEVKKNLSDIKA